jgi:hypothetical protein
MNENGKLRNALLALLIVALLGWWAGRFHEMIHQENPSAVPQARTSTAAPRKKHPVPASAHVDRFSDGTTVEMFASQYEDQLILRFPSDTTYKSFLGSLIHSPLVLVSKLDRLRAIRIGYTNRMDLEQLLEGENITLYSSLPQLPTPRFPERSDQSGVVGFGDGLLEWLGVPSNHSQWGRGVKIAVIDSGVLSHEDIPGLVKSIEITPFPDDPSQINGHGTAVASLIAGVNEMAPGLAPAAELISIRVSDDVGEADSFALAAGILAAVDEKVDLINISMGSEEDNPLIRDAILHAQSEGIMIIASSGNSEGAQSHFPAAYPGVISVGAVDAGRKHLDFANFGDALSLTAPGWALNSAWPGNRYARISGTSASAPIVTGAIAATMSDGRGRRMSAVEAAEIIMRYTDEAGIPGPDSQYGIGILNMGRVLHRNARGVFDVAITDQRLIRTHFGDGIQVTIQNRGNEVLVNVMLTVQTPDGTRDVNTTTLPPGGVKSFTLPMRILGERLGVRSSVIAHPEERDVTPWDNVRTDLFER